MTDSEQQQLLDIERRLSTEAPELAHLLGGATPAGYRRRPPWYRWALGLAVIAAVLLVCLGVVLGSAPLAVVAVCPPVTALLLVLWDRRRRRPGQGPGQARRR